jgi:hypothetical protein
MLAGAEPRVTVLYDCRKETGEEQWMERKCAWAALFPEVVTLQNVYRREMYPWYAPSLGRNRRKQYERRREVGDERSRGVRGVY